MDTGKFAKIFKALSNENRLELFLEIMKMNETCFEAECGECFITDIIDSLNIGAPTVSHHLKELSNAGLITTERRGKFLVARIRVETLEEAMSLFR
ncbi:MAG TPA: metalloregulator ArsR/SmtB family transcription factor [Spirochaetota bacterium]|nr:metalloregulator ArsR/SmtB family transcription factor [Spirochaetota bacterium]HQO03498.1 metalloregulator ArsR/SmtB family transcription factor [Spirochaetota bacterium]HQP48848.1 metalloregulator ArsR/SmtB family transcription factor [Spirochaetota bacterium]